MLGVFLDHDSLDRQDLDFIQLESALPSWQMYPQTASENMAERLAGASVVVSNKVVLDASTLTRASDLELICVAATGTNNVDLAAAKARGITVCNVRAYGTA